MLEKTGTRFLSQEFQFNTIYGETLIHKGMTDDAERVLNLAFENENISSETDKFYGYVSRADVDVALEKYDEALKNCREALKIPNQNSNRGLLKKCKCLHLESVANEKNGKVEEGKKQKN